MPHPLLDELRRTVESALAAGDATAAAAALRAHGRGLAAEDGAGFRALVARLPDVAWQHDPVIASAMGASFRSAGSPPGRAAIGYFSAADAGFAGAGREADPDRVTVWLGHAAALRALGRIDDAARYVDRAIGLDGPGSILSVPVRVELGARSTLEAGMIALHRGDVETARRRLEFASGLAPGNLTRAERIECLGSLAMVDYLRADLGAATRHCAETRALADGTDLLASCYGASTIAAESLVALERGDVDTATALEQHLAVAAANSEWEPYSHVIAAYLRLADGRHAEGLDRLHVARQGFRSWTPPALGLALEELVRAALLVALDQGDEAWSILRGLPPHENHLLCSATVIAQLRLANGDLRGAVESLRGCEELGEDHSPRTILGVRLLRAAIEFERGEYAVSDVMLDRALASMARTGARAPLRMVPPRTLAGLAARALTRRHDPAVANLLRALVHPATGAGRLVEPLSPRELLVLAEVEKGSTVAGIAAALYISPNTVKTHLRRLYRKLGVTTRAEAIRKAKSLGLGGQITRESPVPQDADTTSW